MYYPRAVTNGGAKHRGSNAQPVAVHVDTEAHKDGLADPGVRNIHDMAMPFTDRKMAMRYALVNTRQERLAINVFENGKYYSDRTLQPQWPRFRPCEALRRAIYRCVTLDGFVIRMVANLFTAFGQWMMAMTVTMMSVLENMGVSQFTKQNIDGNQSTVSIFTTLAVLLIAVSIIGGVVFLYYAYNAYWRDEQEVDRELVFEFQIAKYTALNPYARNYAMEFNARSGQDPDAVIMAFMDEEEIPRGPRRRNRCKRFFIIEMVDMNDSRDGFFDHMLCCCRRGFFRPIDREKIVKLETEIGH